MSDLKKWQSTLAKVACVLPDTEWFEEALTILAELEAARRVVYAARSIYYRPEQDGGRLVSAKEFDQMQAEIADYDLTRKGEK